MLSCIAGDCSRVSDNVKVDHHANELDRRALGGGPVERETFARTIRIGPSGPLTRRSASLGIAMRDGARLAVSEINEAQAKSTNGREIREALENLQTKVEGLITIDDHLFSAADHEAIDANIPVSGVVRYRHVIETREDDVARDRAVRVNRGFGTMS